MTATLYDITAIIIFLKNLIFRELVSNRDFFPVVARVIFSSLGGV